MRWMAALLLLAGVCRAQEDGGGRDVSVLLFSAQPVQRAVVSASGAGAWWAACVLCRHQPLTGTLRMPDMHEVFLGGPVTVRGDGQVRSANGAWHLKVSARGTVDVVLTLPSERYVAAVLMGETSAIEQPESLRAMAVVARTFALRMPPAKVVPGHLASDVCDSTTCQAMKLGPVPAAVLDAVRATAGETVWFGGRRAQVFFGGSCGGVTESAGAVWPTLRKVLYLRSTVDPYCVRKDRAAWHAEVPVADLEQVAKREGWRLPARTVSVAMMERTASGRARTLLLTGADGASVKVSASAVRLAVGRSLGWNLLRSDLYDVRVRNGVVVFDGRGHGHGVGLCQQGALEMAKVGKGYREILGFYFAGTAVRITKNDEGWRSATVGGVPVVSASLLRPGLAEDVTKARAFARGRFPAGAGVVPSVRFAPSTEMFRQLTGQPGWDAASTSGAAIVVQPESVLLANRVSMQGTLRHEMLHVAVESRAHAKVPLWLREGLVEVLAGDAVPAGGLLSVADTERMLRAAGTLAESQSAHRSAAVQVKRLVDRYGMSAVERWLSTGSGVPPE